MGFVKRKPERKDSSGERQQRRQVSNSPIEFRQSFRPGGQGSIEQADKSFMKFKQQIDKRIEKQRKKYYDQNLRRTHYIEDTSKSKPIKQD